MAIITNETTKYDINGIKESVADFIYNISPTDTPFLANAGRMDVTQPVFSWQIDALAAAAANAQLEGDAIVTTPNFAAVVSTTLQSNYTQISYKAISVSSTADASAKYGRGTETGLQISKRSLELKRDIELTCLGNVAVSAGTTAAARKTGGLATWVRTNVDKGASTNPTAAAPFPVARTDSGSRALTESLVKNMLQLAYTSGANIGTLLCGPVHKQQVSGFGGIATKTYSMSTPEAAAIIGAADIYVSDFGVLTVVPDRFLRLNSSTSAVADIWGIDWDAVAVAYLQPFKVDDLAKTGLMTNKVVSAEWGLMVKNEAALGLVADLA